MAGAAALAAGLPRPAPASDDRGSLVLNDASGLEPTRVARHGLMRRGDDTVVAELRRLLKEAAAENRPLVPAGARHSMGGQSLRSDSVAVTFAHPSCAVDRETGLVRAAAGARWRDVTAVLDPTGWSVAVMQSNNDFSVGGSICVNAHGWAVPQPPIGATVRSFRLLLADGTLLRCAADENPELFGLAIGGYGLFGILIDAELQAVRNVMLVPAQELMRAGEVGTRLTEAVRRPGTRMAYGRLSVSASDFLTQAVVVTFAETPHSGSLPSASAGTLVSYLSGTVVRAQRGSEAGKRARWYAETVLGPRLAPRTLTRNRLLNQSVSPLAGVGRRHTDILHEYFVPPERVADFLDACRRLIPRSGQDLLNVTLRFVDADTRSMLAFAPAPRVAAVMLFSQARTPAAELSMRLLTEALIEAALELNGSFYLPYRLHATREQVRRAYPALEAVLDRKRFYDPAGRFRNRMYDAYTG